MPTVPPQELGQEPYDFERELYELVHDTAPRLFAVVATYDVGGPDEDARVVAWGQAWPERADVVAVRGARLLRLTRPDHVVRYFRCEAGFDVRLVWLAPSGGADAPGRAPQPLSSS